MKPYSAASFTGVFFLSLALTLCSHGLHAQEDSDTTRMNQKISAIDTSQVEKKAFATKEVQSLQKDPDLNYKTPPTVAESFWTRLMSFLFRLFAHLFKGATTTTIGKAIIYLALLGLIIVTILVILKVNAFRVFFSGADEGKISATMFHENIHEMNFDKLIREAVEAQHFREGTRLVFLYALKILSDKQLILWNPGKTNHDYVEELKEDKLKAGFNELSFYFDYAWYGNFPVSAETFQKIQSSFLNWRDNEVMRAN